MANRLAKNALEREAERSRAVITAEQIGDGTRGIRPELFTLGYPDNRTILERLKGMKNG